MGGPTPYCRDCRSHVRLTAFAGVDDLSCAVCEGGNWFFDNSRPGVLRHDPIQIGEPWSDTIIGRGRFRGMHDGVERWQEREVDTDQWREIEGTRCPIQ